MRNLRVQVDLTVADEADDIVIADFIMDLLVNDAEVAESQSIFSVDGTTPERS